MSAISRNIEHVLNSIERARLAYNNHHVVHMVAVSKNTDSSSVLEAYTAGQLSFAESRVQGLQDKMLELSNLPIRWHMIGTLQENKINSMIKLNPSLFQSLHSLDLADALQKRLQAQGKTLDALLQINSSRESSKHGFMTELAERAYDTVTRTCPNIRLQGIMCIASNTDDTLKIEGEFAKTKNLFDRLRKHGARILSMGMSGDYEIAIACGSNLVRIGSRIFS